MLKGKWNKLLGQILKNSRILFPVILIGVVAITVLIALNAGNNKDLESSEEETSEIVQTEESRVAADQIPLIQNEDSGIESLIRSYYKAKGEGDTATMLSLSDNISETDLLYYAELSKYINEYNDLHIFTKKGPVADSVIAYVYLHMDIKDYCGVPGYEAHYICKNEEGIYYIKNQSSCTDEEKEYIKTLNEQVDVVEFNNRVNVEYDELMAEKPELLEYLGILGEQVQIAVGVVLAEQNVDEQPAEEQVQTESEEEGGSLVEPEGESLAQNQVPETVYAKATTTVNVRSSDSEKADKLGKLTGGSKVQVQEVRVNGWTKIVFENKDGYVKSEFLAMEESANGYESVGTIVANTNINVRSAAGETAERLGVLAGGESAELIALEGDWCKIKYNGQVGYVKAEYVTQ